ncbi:MAG: hypothetical protein QXP22_02425 [Candidatus Anstonellales archaeon]
MFEYSIILVMLITGIGALYDLFNKKEVPDNILFILIFISFLYSIFFTDFYFGILQALLILSIGYIAYKRGLLGFADVIFFSCIALIIPYKNIAYIKLPFVLPVFVYSGLFFAVASIIYYGFRMAKNGITKINIAGIFPLLAFLIFLFFYKDFMFFSTFFIFLIFFAVLISSFYIAFEHDLKRATSSEEKISEQLIEDIIAYDLLNEKQKAVIGNKRVVDEELLQKLKENNIKTLPVYKHLLPFLPFLLIGSIFAYLYGFDFLFGFY